MTDIVSPVARSQMMAGIKGKNTGPELVIRRALHRKGLRFRIHVSDLPGKPDIVFPKFRAVIFINGCFWHGHECHLFKWPSSRVEFWKKKITGNRNNDMRYYSELGEKNWRVLSIWECALKGKNRLIYENLINDICKWLLSSEGSNEITGKI